MQFRIAFNDENKAQPVVKNLLSILFSKQKQTIVHCKIGLYRLIGDNQECYL